MVRVTRELAALERNSCIRPAVVLPMGTPANEVATPLPIFVERHTVEKSMNPPGANSAPPMRKENGGLSASAAGAAGTACGEEAAGIDEPAEAARAGDRLSSFFCWASS